MEPVYSLERFGQMRGLDAEIADSNPPFASLVDLTGQAAIVTGGGRGLGFQVVNRLVEAGAKVLIADVATDFAEDAVAYFNGKGGTVEYAPCDVRDLGQIQAALDQAVAAFGQVDILVNIAAVLDMSVFTTMTEAMWDRSMDINAKGAVFFAQAVANQMIERGIKGRIVNVLSHALNPASTFYYTYQLQYSASKAALRQATEVMARFLQPHGIVATCVIPGSMRSAGAFLTQRPEEVPMDPGPRAPMTMNPDEVARMVFALCTDLAVFANGSVVTCDGGASLGARDE
ncbi:MAG: SDR family oxidoreductase [Propionibacteriaceae bacterium]|jgi:NAD(P)-dependent dehydrogenase (short-subunit alcohol dehydrogenase family)|nr:SDR family oxidoreductase [Propionibacteriaceae bacterium]